MSNWRTQTASLWNHTCHLRNVVFCCCVDTGRVDSCPPKRKSATRYKCLQVQHITPLQQRKHERPHGPRPAMRNDTAAWPRRYPTHLGRVPRRKVGAIRTASPACCRQRATAGGTRKRCRVNAIDVLQRNHGRILFVSVSARGCNGALCAREFCPALTSIFYLITNMVGHTVRGYSVPPWKNTTSTQPRKNKCFVAPLVDAL